MYKNIGTVLGIGHAWLICITAWWGHSRETGISANGIKCVSLLACRVLVYFRNTVMQERAIERLPVVIWQKGWKSNFVEGNKLEIQKKHDIPARTTVYI